jgi:hypothetical protein
MIHVSELQRRAAVSRIRDESPRAVQIRRTMGPDRRRPVHHSAQGFQCSFVILHAKPRSREHLATTERAGSPASKARPDAPGDPEPHLKGLARRGLERDSRAAPSIDPGRPGRTCPEFPSEAARLASNRAPAHGRALPAQMPARVVAARACEMESRCDTGCCRESGASEGDHSPRVATSDSEQMPCWRLPSCGRPRAS